MEKYEDDDFSDLYADVEVQASTAISALNRLMEMRSVGVGIPDKATQRNVKDGDAFSGVEMSSINGAFYKHDNRVGDRGGDLTKLPMENGDSRLGYEENKRSFDGSSGNTQSNSEFRAVNMRKCEGRDEEDQKVSQRKNLIYDQLAYKKIRVNETATAARKNGDAKEAKDRDLCGRRGGGIVSSERGPSAHARDPHYEVSECSSDGTHDNMETSHNTNRRNSSSVSGSEPSQTEPESKSTQSEWNQHGPSLSYSASPCASLGDSYSENSCKHSENHMRPLEESKKHQRKSSTEFDKDCRRLSSVIMKGLDEHKKPYGIFDQKTYDRRISHREQGSMLDFGFKEKDLFYCYQSGSSVSYSNGFYPHGLLGPVYLENRRQDIHPGYRTGLRDGCAMSKRDRVLKRNYEMKYEALEDDLYRNKRRHVPGKLEHWPSLIPKYSSAAGLRDNQFRNRDPMHLRNSEGKRDIRFIEGNGRYVSSGERSRDQPDLRYYRDMANNRRGRQSFERGRRKHDHSLSSSRGLCSIKTVDNERKYIKHRSVPFYSYEEPRAHGRRKSLGFDGRQFQLSTNRYAMNRIMKDHDGRDRFLMEKHHQQNVLHSKVKLYNSRHQDGTKLHSDGLPYHSERISRDNMTDDSHAFGDVSELIDEREAYRHRIKMMGEDHSSRFDGCHKIFLPHCSVQENQRRYLDSVELHLASEGKKITSEAGDHKNHGRNNLREWDDHRRPTGFRDSDAFKPENAVSKESHETHQKAEYLDIEEGQIITEENIENGPAICAGASEKATSNSKGVVEGLDDDKIMEIITKMEKRRERFKEPIISSKCAEKICSQLFDLDVASSEKGKFERPARKRKWF